MLSCQPLVKAKPTPVWHNAKAVEEWNKFKTRDQNIYSVFVTSSLLRTSFLAFKAYPSEHPVKLLFHPSQKPMKTKSHLHSSRWWHLHNHDCQGRPTTASDPSRHLETKEAMRKFGPFRSMQKAREGTTTKTKRPWILTRLCTWAQKSDPTLVFGESTRKKNTG